jgi:hypothetical protein
MLRLLVKLQIYIYFMAFPNNNLENQEQLKPTSVYGLEHLTSGAECLVNLHETDDGEFIAGILPKLINVEKTNGSKVFGSMNEVNPKVEAGNCRSIHGIKLLNNQFIFDLEAKNPTAVFLQTQIQEILEKALNNSDEIINYKLNI